MATKIFLNLPVKDLDKSVAFYTRLGFTFNPQFTDETATCMIVGENIFVMLLTESKFLQFTKKQIADTSEFTEVLISIDAESNQAVDELVEKAIQAGGRQPVETKDYGFMYQRSFEDLDGHHWEVLFMDMSKFPGA